MCAVNQKTSRLKRAELLSGVGAVVLGMGLKAAEIYADKCVHSPLFQ